MLVQMECKMKSAKWKTKILTFRQSSLRLIPCCKETGCILHFKLCILNYFIPFW